MKIILPTNRKQAIFLKKLLNESSYFCEEHTLSPEFCKLLETDYDELLPLAKALHSKNVIELIPEDGSNTYPRIKILSKAYSYIPDRNDKIIRFWIPTTISVIALLRPEITTFIKWFVRLCLKK